MKKSKYLHNKAYNNRHTTSLIERIYMKYVYLFRMLHILFIKKTFSMSILDIGYGDGNFLSFLPNRIFKKYGIDLEKRSNDINITHYEGEYERLKMNKKFDVITAFHVIEHIDNPQEFIEKSYSQLNKGGLLFIVTPNIESIGFKIAKEKWYHYDYPYHKTIFSKDKLRQLLIKNSFNTISFSGEFPGFPFDAFKTIKNLGKKWTLFLPLHLILKIFISETIVCTCKK